MGKYAFCTAWELADLYRRAAWIKRFGGKKASGRAREAVFGLWKRSQGALEWAIAHKPTTANYQINAR